MAGVSSASSIPNIISLGSNLSTALDLLLVSQRFPQKDIIELNSDISATTGSLRQLQKFIDDDEAARTAAQGQVTILKDAGLKEINDRAAQLEILFRAVIANIAKAGSAATRSKNKIKAEAIDTNFLRMQNIARGGKYTWLKPRIRRCAETLNLVKVHLFFILQIANLAKHQCCSTTRMPGMFDEEMAIRLVLDRLRGARIHESKQLAKKYYVSPPNSANSSEVDLSLPDLTHEEKVLLKLIRGKWSWTQIRRKYNAELSQSLNIRKLQAKSRRIQEKIQAKQLMDKLDSDSSTEEIKIDKEKPVIDITKKSEIVEEIVVVSGSSTKPPPYAESSGIKKDVPIIEKEKPIKKAGEKLGPGLAPPPVLPESKEKTSGPLEVAEVVVDASHPFVKEQLKAVDVITMSDFKKQFGRVDSWFKELFGPTRLFFDDKKSENIEAFMILGDEKCLKIAFGHRRLKFGMKKLMKAKKESMLDDYYALPKHLQVAINHVLMTGKLSDSRDRVIICFDVLKLGEKLQDQHLVVFFAPSGPPVEPIHFTDCVGRKFSFPFHAVQIFDEMRHMVNLAFLHVEGLGPHVIEGHYDLMYDGTIVLPMHWDGIVKPGMQIKMHMWPMSENEQPRPYRGPPGFRPPLPLLPRPCHNPLGYLNPGGFGSTPIPPPPPGSRPFMGTLGPPGRPYPPGSPPVVAPPPPGWKPKPGPGPPGSRPLGPGPKRPPGWKPPPPRPAAMRRGSYCSYSSSYCSNDSSFLGSDSDIENEDVDLGLKLDYAEEKKNAMVEVKEMLEKWTNAIDVEAGPIGYSSDSFTGTDSSCSFADD